MPQNDSAKLPTESATPTAVHHRWKAATSAGIFLLVSVSLLVLLLWRASHSTVTDAATVTISPESPPVKEEGITVAEEPVVQWRSEQLVGKWLLRGMIQREIEMHPDGTAVMKCKLDPISSLIYGSRLVMNLNWTLENGILTHSVTGGEPKANVDKLTEAYGKTLSYQVIRVDENSLVLKGPFESKSLENWVAVKPHADIAKPQD
ncbi:MAG TPA: hypothetical protein VNQ76_16215 [Planctomicrobium sp.]|nr:hypothetical protein [Planctomicrobium sp.]